MPFAFSLLISSYFDSVFINQIPWYIPFWTAIKCRVLRAHVKPVNLRGRRIWLVNNLDSQIVANNISPRNFHFHKTYRKNKQFAKSQSIWSLYLREMGTNVKLPFLYYSTDVRDFRITFPLSDYFKPCWLVEKHGHQGQSCFALYGYSVNLKYLLGRKYLADFQIIFRNVIWVSTKLYVDWS